MASQAGSSCHRQCGDRTHEGEQKPSNPPPKEKEIKKNVSGFNLRDCGYRVRGYVCGFLSSKHFRKQIKLVQLKRQIIKKRIV